MHFQNATTVSHISLLHLQGFCAFSYLRQFIHHLQTYWQQHLSLLFSPSSTFFLVFYQAPSFQPQATSYFTVRNQDKFNS